VNGVTLSLICHLDMGSIRYRSNTQHSDIRELRVLDGLFRWWIVKVYEMAFPRE
jgi:hypothetical protein